MSEAGNQDQRTLNLRFDTHVNNDAVFKKEVISLMIANIRELQEAAYQAYDLKDASIYHSVEHKARSAVRLLNDKEFEECIANLKVVLSVQEDADRLRAIDTFRLLADSIIQSLEHAKQQLRPG